MNSPTQDLKKGISINGPMGSQGCYLWLGGCELLPQKESSCCRPLWILLSKAWHITHHLQLHVQEFAGTIHGRLCWGRQQIKAAINTRLQSS